MHAKVQMHVGAPVPSCADELLETEGYVLILERQHHGADLRCQAARRVAAELA